MCWQILYENRTRLRHEYKQRVMTIPKKGWNFALVVQENKVHFKKCFLLFKKTRELRKEALVIRGFIELLLEKRERERRRRREEETRLGKARESSAPVIPSRRCTTPSSSSSSLPSFRLRTIERKKTRGEKKKTSFQTLHRYT